MIALVGVERPIVIVGGTSPWTWDPGLHKVEKEG